MGRQHIQHEYAGKSDNSQPGQDGAGWHEIYHAHTVEFMNYFRNYPLNIFRLQLTTKTKSVDKGGLLYSFT